MSLTDMTSTAYQATKRGAAILAAVTAVGCSGATKPTEPLCKEGQAVAVKSRWKAFTLYDCAADKNDVGEPVQFIGYERPGSQRKIYVTTQPGSPLNNYTVAQLDSIYDANVK